MKKHTEYVLVLVAAAVAVAIGLSIYAGSGAYDIGADTPHTKPVLALVTWARDRSLDVHSASIAVPDLEDQSLSLKGAGQYAAMCTACHLSPGVENSEQREGMYPIPPNLSRARFTPQREFWAIKHGIKMSGMPAWGVNHDDATIWSLVAFLQKLPDMTPEEYRAIVAKAPPDTDMDHDHHHEPDPAQTPMTHADMPNMALPQAAFPEPDEAHPHHTAHPRPGD